MTIWIMSTCYYNSFRLLPPPQLGLLCYTVVNYYYY